METITAILTVWKRNHLEEQLQAFIGQTLKPDIIWVQQTQRHVNVDDVILKYQNHLQYTYQEENLGVFGRFESVRQVTTSYVYILDDDIIPGCGFLENALNASKRLNAIISPNGRLLNKNTYSTEVFVGDGDEFQHSFSAVDTKVDYGNNSWFYRSEWIQYFLQEVPLYRNNGEDIHLSATCLLFRNIPTYVPQQIIPHESGSTKRIYSADEFALHQKPAFGEERIETIERFKKMGWRLQLEDKSSLPVPSQPAISIVIPVLEKTADAELAIRSILDQTFEDFECITIYSGAWDVPLQIRDSRIHWIDTKQVLPKYTMLNIACGLATGKYVCLMCQEYVSLPKRLEIQQQYMEAHNDVVATGMPKDCKKIFHPSLFIRNKILRQIHYYKKPASTLAETDLISCLLLHGRIMFLHQELMSKL